MFFSRCFALSVESLRFLTVMPDGFLFSGHSGMACGRKRL
jgi:hypothetical protein